MSDFNSEYYSEGDFEDSGEAIWDEYKWSDYLARTKKDVVYFVEMYHKLRDGELGWDDVSRNMGWTMEAPKAQEETKMLDGNAIFMEVTAQLYTEEDIQEYLEEEPDPWTMHRHPAFVITEGLTSYIKENYENLMQTFPQVTSAVISWELLKELEEVSKNAYLALHALELAEFALTITQLKYSLDSLNKIMGILGQIKTKKSEQLDNMQAAVFDLRDAYIKVTTDCRSYMASE